ncbi:hypothetical protein TREMEDRAFT_41238 [Tremella mesenterica DSM 1558]|uniref:uncharacterized protein n=1 Tax=Tremella mesenterica (strain ATCC 24925 / CBS 8224 / DSM 1558 / NBRC 9311 / NRRL Y-6157 / RJB 2259-6 / UBC 559-6) TaxID=578456 RepID=UPI00032BE464|nr:uncharacterized protein TREMEDRAFT_41238 [Tremella mesenterica DSM 1558]EIW65769.1 hypothetical protein TREMEDRAFT_41238 [Tremella mesenterica DSM 1558]
MDAYVPDLDRGYARSRGHSDDGREHRSHRDREEYDRRRPREHERERNGGGRDHDRDIERHRPRDDRDRDRGYRRDDRERDRYDRERHRRDDPIGMAEPMGGPGGYRERRPPPRDEFAQPMRSYSPRRDNGPPDDGGYRGRGGERGGRGGRRQSPPRSPTPPGTIALEERKVKHSLWDIRPVQFAGIGAMAAKMTGMFTYGPGRVPPPPELGIPSALIAGSFPPPGANGLRQAKRIYVGGITESMTDASLLEFFNTTMSERGFTLEIPGDPIGAVQVNHEKAFAFLEFRSAEEASSALKLDNVMFEDVPLRVKRPKDYTGLDPLQHTMGGAQAMSDSPNKLFIGGLPTYLDEAQVMELLKSFGELRSFNLVKDPDSSENKGFAFAEYTDPSNTDMAISGLNNFSLGDRILVVQRAAVGRASGTTDAIPGSESFLAKSAIFAQENQQSGPTSRVMLLLNMVTADELYDDQEYQEILEDITSECSRFGEIEGVRVPRPVPKSKKWEPSESAVVTQERARRADLAAGVGRVFVMYKDLASTEKAMNSLGGRQFGGRTIVVANVPEEEFLGPAPPPPPPPEQDLDAAAADAVKDIMADLTS